MEELQRLLGEEEALDWLERLPDRSKRSLERFAELRRPQAPERDGEETEDVPGEVALGCLVEAAKLVAEVVLDIRRGVPL